MYICSIDTHEQQYCRQKNVRVKPSNKLGKSIVATLKG